MDLRDIDISFDMRSDCPQPKPGSNHIPDPDNASPTLKHYHKLLWSKQLPNGEYMEMEMGKDCYLKWKNFYFGSDSIIVSFMHARNKLRHEIESSIPHYPIFREQYLRKASTIGGYMIFPQHRNSMNQMRGCNRKISDRWDLTLECIKLFYLGEDSPLHKIISSDAAFYKLFVDFKGFVDFFLLQDCVDEDYNVIKWLDTTLGDTYPLPKTLEEYHSWINQELAFLEKRAKRIEDYCKRQRLNL